MTSTCIHAVDLHILSDLVNFRAKEVAFKKRGGRRKHFCGLGIARLGKRKSSWSILRGSVYFHEVDPRTDTTYMKIITHIYKENIHGDTYAYKDIYTYRHYDAYI